MLVLESRRLTPTNMHVHGIYMVKYNATLIYLDIVECVLVHGVGWSLSVQFEHNHPTIMPYTMRQ